MADGTAQEQGGVKTLESRDLFGFHVYSHGNLAAWSDLPIGYVEWNGKHEVWCATRKQMEQSFAICDGKYPIGREWNVLRDGTTRQVAEIAYMAFGGDGRSKYSIEQLERHPYGFWGCVQAAIVAFLWAGPVSSRNDPIPEELRPAQETS